MQYSFLFLFIYGKSILCTAVKKLRVKMEKVGKFSLMSTSTRQKGVSAKNRIIILFYQTIQKMRLRLPANCHTRRNTRKLLKMSI